MKQSPCTNVSCLVISPPYEFHKLRSKELCSIPPRYNTKPRMMIHKSQNLTIAFKFMTVTEKIPLVNIGTYMYEILELIWRPIHFTA